MYLSNICLEGWYFFPMAVFLVIIFFGIVFARRGFRNKWMHGFCGDHYGPKWMQNYCRDHQGTGVSESVIDILKKRYAKGEISKEEFGQMRKELED